jgi:hypothetical protein
MDNAISNRMTIQKAYNSKINECQQKVQSIGDLLRAAKALEAENWAYVGDLNHIAEQLDAILEFLNCEV